MTGQSLYRDDLFAGQVAIVTGGGTGIGLCIAEELVRLGAKVVIASRKKQRLEVAARGLAADYGADVLPVACNIRERADIEQLFERAVAHFGAVDHVVNNGGGQFLSPARDIRPKGWQAVIDTNLTGTFNMCQVAHAHWTTPATDDAVPAPGAVRGRIVNIVADMWRGFPGMVHTGASRAGVVNLTKTLAIEWATDGVLINAVAPGTILSTGMNNYPPEVVAAAATLVPLKRLGRELDVAWAVLHLLSPAGDFTTGSTVRVDGGASLWSSPWMIPDPASPPPPTIPPWPEDRWPEIAAAVAALDDGPGE